MKTVKISQDTELGYRWIYAEDFNSATDVEFDVKVTLVDPKPAKKTKKSSTAYIE